MREPSKQELIMSKSAHQSAASIKIELGEIRDLDFQRFAVAVGDINPIYFSDDAAQEAGYPGVVAPPNYITSIIGWGAGPLEHELMDDGAPAAELPEDLRGLRLMGGGNEITLGEPVRPGYIVSCTVTHKETFNRLSKRSELTFVVSEKVYTNQFGTVLATCTETVIAAP